MLAGACTPIQEAERPLMAFRKDNSKPRACHIRMIMATLRLRCLLVPRNVNAGSST